MYESFQKERSTFNIERKNKLCTRATAFHSLIQLPSCCYAVAMVWHHTQILYNKICCSLRIFFKIWKWLEKIWRVILQKQKSPNENKNDSNLLSVLSARNTSLCLDQTDSSLVFLSWPVKNRKEYHNGSVFAN